MKNEARMKLFWSGMYVSAPADPSPPSTSNFIPELPSFNNLVLLRLRVGPFFPLVLSGVLWAARRAGRPRRRESDPDAADAALGPGEELQRRAHLAHRDSD